MMFINSPEEFYEDLRTRKIVSVVNHPVMDHLTLTHIAKTINGKTVWVRNSKRGMSALDICSRIAGRLYKKGFSVEIINGAERTIKFYGIIINSGDAFLKFYEKGRK